MQAAPLGLSRGKCAAVLALAALVLLAAALSRSFEYDEAYTVFLTAGVPRPHWPVTPFLAGAMRGLFHARAGLPSVAHDLRATDVHPPLYFWAIDLWRRALGDSLIIARLFSVCCALFALLAVARVARLSGIALVPAVLLTLGCYGFTYTGIVARGFALALALALWAFVCAIESPARPRKNLAAGLLLGAATATNYLAVFLIPPVLIWMTVRRAWRDLVLTALAAGLFAPLDLWFFLAQRGSRTGQFPPFHLIGAMLRLARSFAGALFGALPLYVPFPLSIALGLALAILLVLVIAFVVARWRHSPGPRLLFALAALAPAAGLILLGLVFNNTPIELRYLAFATPFCALLLAGAAQTALHGRAFLCAVGLAQGAAIAGLILHPATMQPARRTAAEAARLAQGGGVGGVVLVPYGNDGAGLVGPFVAEAPDNLRILVVPDGTTPAQLKARLAGIDRAVLALPTPDAESTGAVPAIVNALVSLCWIQHGGAGDVAVFRRCR